MNQKRVAVLTFVLGILVGMGLATVTVAAQRVAPGVNVSSFGDGTTCYTNSAGGIACFR